MTEEQQSEKEIVKEQALEQRTVVFIGDELAAARTTNETIYLSFPGKGTVRLVQAVP